MREYYITVQGRVFETCEGLEKAKERAEEVANCTRQLTWISYKNGKLAFNKVWGWYVDWTPEDLMTHVNVCRVLCENIACKEYTPKHSSRLDYFDSQMKEGIEGRHALGCMHRLPDDEMTSRTFQAYAEGLRKVVEHLPKTVTVKVKGRRA